MKDHSPFSTINSPEQNRFTILLVEDNPEILKANTFMLERAGYAVLCAENVEQARDHIEDGMPDLMVLDILLPDGSGLAFCEEVRRRAETPILFLTALGESGDIVTGLRTGGDDYLSKPYEYDVLLAHIEALLRRAGRINPVLRRGPLELDAATTRALLNGKDLLLTPHEFAILLALVQNEGTPVSAADLYERAWGVGANDEVRSLRKHIHRLREKLEAVGARFAVETRYGQGYLFRAKDE